MREELMEIIAEIAEVEFNEVKLESLLEDDLEMDSLMFLDLIVRLQKIINKEIRPEEMVTIKTVNDVIDFVKENKE